MALEGLEGVQQIQDDMVVHGAGQIHDERLEAALERMEKSGLTLRREKCRFGVAEVLWFGHVYNKEGMSLDPQKVENIKSWPRPIDKSEVKSFLQTVQFCSTYMRPGNGRTYADVTEPLRKLTNKNLKFIWSNECEKSFNELKDLLTANTVMANFETDRKTRLYVDHGPSGVAATVAQEHMVPGNQDRFTMLSNC